MAPAIPTAMLGAFPLEDRFGYVSLKNNRLKAEAHTL
jgi:hypothetical protein